LNKFIEKFEGVYGKWKLTLLKLLKIVQ
jgi:hypothetical protein